MKIVRKEHPKDDDGDMFYVARTDNTLSGQPKKSVGRRISPFIIFGIAVSLSTIGVLKLMGDSPADTESTVLALQGKKVLDENSLRNLVISQKLTAYWIGPRDNYKYAITPYPNGQVFIRYLPNGKGLAETTPSYLVIATYPLKNAFSVTRKTSAGLNGIGFTSVDGHAIYYKTTQPASVYVGLRNADFQIEIFDPVAGQALVSASTAGLLRQVE